MTQRIYSVVCYPILHEIVRANPNDGHGAAIQAVLNASHRNQWAPQVFANAGCEVFLVREETGQRWILPVEQIAMLAEAAAKVIESHSIEG